MNQTLQRIDRRAFSHDMSDGLTEIAMAIVFLVLIVIWHNPGFMWMTILPILVIGPGLRKIRARTTYPRIGYVKPRGEKPAELFKGIALYAVGVTAAVGLGITLWQGRMTTGVVRQFSPFLASLLFGGGLLYAAGRSGLRRFYVLFAISVALGIWIAFANEPGSYDGLQTYLVSMAAIFFVFGLLTFVVFLRKNPVREVTEDGHDD